MIVSSLLIAVTLLFAFPAFGMSENDSVTYNLDEISDISNQHITQITQDRKGFLWLSSWNGLYRFDGYDFVTFKAKPGDGNGMNSCRLRNIVLDYEITPATAVGNIFCHVDDDVFLFNVRTAKFVPVSGKLNQKARQAFKRNGTRIQNFKDNRGIMWRITPEGFIRSVPRVRDWHRLEGITRATTRMMYRDDKGMVWIGTKDGRLTVFDQSLSLIGYMGKDGRIHDKITNFYPIYTMCEDADGAIWFGSKPFGLFRLHSNKLAHIDGLNSQDIYDLKTDCKDRVWIATQKGGISVINKLSSGRYSITPIKQTTGLLVRRLLILDDGTLLATTTTGLLVADNIYNQIGKIRWRMHQRGTNRTESLSDNATMNIANDSKGRLFITTESGGLNLLTTKDLHADKFSFKHYDMRNGFGSDVTMTCAWLTDDVLLIQCNNMLSLFNTKTAQIENYSRSFWGENIRFSDAEPLLLDNGQLLISLQDGVLTIPMSELYTIDYKPHLVLTCLHLPDIPADYTIDYKDTIIISPTQRNFSLSFSALDYADNRYIRYSTKLDDDSKWSSPTATNHIDFRDIDAGTHILSIRSTNALGQWTENTRTITIIVEPTFFEAWYGKLLATIIILAVIAIIIYIIMYVRYLEKRQMETLDAYLLLLEQNSSAVANEQEETETRPEPIVIAPHLSAEDETFMRKITDFIEKNISDSDININDMATAAAVSRSGLNRKMRQLLGITPADFLKEARMKRAIRMLKETDTAVPDIAYACGFSDPKYFAKCVKASTGKTPRELRE